MLVIAMNTTDFESILKKYNKFHSLNDDYFEIMSNSDVFTNKDRQDIMNCGDILGFNNEHELISANFCRKRICPMCQWRKSEKTFSQTIRLAERLTKDNYRFLHLVLTVPNCTHNKLNSTINAIYNAFSKFIKYKDIKRAYKGIMRCLEITINYETHEFHPHLHCLIAVNKSYFNDSKIYLSYERLQELWTKAYKSDVPLSISIGAIKNNLGFAEVSKYCVKPLDLMPDNIAANTEILTALHYTLKGKRFTQTYGIIKDILKQIKQEDKHRECSITNTEQMFTYIWDSDARRYQKIKNI